jgi:hypothetical protein
MSKHVTTADFVRHARDVHGNRYDYSKASYSAARKYITIICSEHGEFEQWPANHYIGHGCYECGGNKPLTFERFIERANRIHNSRYDYSRVTFRNVESKIEIICPVHRSFFQRLATHLKGLGCNSCGRVVTGKKLSHSRERFLEDARKAHGDRYDYSQVSYINALTKVTIICPDHGRFEQKPANHVRDVGCARCAFESTAALRTLTTQEFIEKAKKVHGDRYDYSKVEYKSSHEKVEIGCSEHGSFWQSPANHAREYKTGCPGCAESGFDQTKPGILYYVAVMKDDGGTLYKIGITNLSVQRRFLNLDLDRMRIVKIWNFPIGRSAAEREAEILSQFTWDRYLGPEILVSAGNTELFTRDVLGLDNVNPEHRQSAVDADANLINRPRQLGFDFQAIDSLIGTKAEDS